MLFNGSKGGSIYSALALESAMNKQEELKIEAYEIVSNLLVIKWNDGQESYISFPTLREACPCAFCVVDVKDAHGNIHVMVSQTRTEASYQLIEITNVGHYALQLKWGDKHYTGIYRYELLRALGDKG